MKTVPFVNIRCTKSLSLFTLGNMIGLSYDLLMDFTKPVLIMTVL